MSSKDVREDSDEYDNQTGQPTTMAQLDPPSRVFGCELARFRARGEDACCNGSPIAWRDARSDRFAF